MNSLVISVPWESHGDIVFDMKIDTVNIKADAADAADEGCLSTFLFVSGGAAMPAELSAVFTADATPIQWKPLTESRLSLWSHVPTAQRHKTVFVSDLADPRVSVVKAIPVALEFWDNLVTACCYDLEEFEVAGDEFTALEQLKTSIVDLYFLLKSEQSRLGLLPQRQWDYLRRMVREN